MRMFFVAALAAFALSAPAAAQQYQGTPYHDPNAQVYLVPPNDRDDYSTGDAIVTGLAAGAANAAVNHLLRDAQYHNGRYVGDPRMRRPPPQPRHDPRMYNQGPPQGNYYRQGGQGYYSNGPGCCAPPQPYMVNRWQEWRGNCLFECVEFSNGDRPPCRQIGGAPQQYRRW